MSTGVTVVASVYQEYGWHCTITSAVDGKHMRASKHYSGQACDFRVKNIPGQYRKKLSKNVALALGPEFDVILEKDHLHVEWDVKS